MPKIDLSMLNQRQTPAFYADVLANRPAAGFIGRIFVSTNTYAFYRDNGTSWDLIGGPGTGTVTGSGVNGQVSFWNGASTLAGSTSLSWDNVNGYLKVGTAIVSTAALQIGGNAQATSYIVTGGTSSQFLKGDGSLDSNTYNTGSGAASQVAFFSGTNAITGENNLWWDSANNHLGINTNTPATALDVNHNGTLVAKFNNTTSANTLVAFENAGNEQWWIGTENTNNDFLFYDATNFPTLSLRTTFKTNGQVLIGGGSTGSGRLVVESSTSDNGIQIVGANAPSLRIDSAATAPTKRIGLGISTAVNNFIQGSVDRDMCIFNGSTTASPILFGVYDAGAGNVQEAARISAARNFLIGRTTDSGEKLQVLGQSKFLQPSANIVAIFEGDWDRNTTNNNQIYIRGYSNTNKQLRIGFDTTSDYGYLQALISGTGTNNISLNPSGGNIGVGTTTPVRLVSIFGGANTSRIILQNTATGQAINNGLDITMDGTDAQVWNYQTGSLQFATSNNERARFSSSGNMLIGTTTDAGYKLRVNGTGYFDNSITSRGDIFTQAVSGGYQISLNAQSTTMAFRFDNLTGAAYGDLEFQAGNGGGFVGRMRIKSSGVINMSSLPTSSAGLVSGDLWNNLGIVNIIP